MEVPDQLPKNSMEAWHSGCEDATSPVHPISRVNVNLSACTAIASSPASFEDWHSMFYAKDG